MATSGSTDYNETKSSLIRDAYIGAGILDPEEGAVSSAQNAYASRVLNRMIKAWQAEGYNLWRRETDSFALVESVAEYQLGGSGTPALAARPLRIVEARYRDANDRDLIMTELSRVDYFRLPDKAAEGTPTQFYYDPGRNQGTFYVWPVPNASTDNTVQITYDRSIEDFDTGANDADYPQEWYEVLVLGLQARLFMANFPTRIQEGIAYLQLSQASLERALGWDRETASTVFLREMSGYDD